MELMPQTQSEDIKTVWIVFEDLYDVAEQSFIGVFTSKDKAIEHLKKFCIEDDEEYDEKEWYVREISVNGPTYLD